MEGIDISNSKWKLSRLNLHMKDCNATLLELKYSESNSISIEDCTLDTWSFKNVKQVMIKNCTNDAPGTPIKLNFYNSSGIIENLNISSQRHNTNEPIFDIRNFSHVNITELTFFNNSVPLASVDSSTIVISESIVDKNQVLDLYRPSWRHSNILANRSIVHISNSKFTDNVAEEYGGAIFIYNNSTLYISNCTLKNNKAGRNGGAIVAVHSVLEIISNSYFTDNVAEEYGGAIHIYNSSLYIINCTLKNNKAGIDGGAIAAFVSVLEINECTFTGNQIVSEEKFNNSGFGGALSLNSNSTAEIQNTIFHSNSAREGAAINVYLNSKVIGKNLLFQEHVDYFLGSIILCENSSELFCANCSFIQNQALKNSSVGAIAAFNHSVINVSVLECRDQNLRCIYLSRSRALVNNSNFNNITLYGAIELINSSISVHNSTFSNNSALFTPAIFSIISFLEVFTSRFENNYGFDATLNLANSTTAVLHDCTFIGNLPCAVYIMCNTNLSITNSIFQNNFGWCGGAITSVSNSILSIANITFLNNSAVALSHDKKLQIYPLLNRTLDKASRGGDGGALSTSNSSVLIQDTVFENNVAETAGGAIDSVMDVNITIKYSIFRNNTVQDQVRGSGGAINVANSLNILITGSLFDKNKAKQGGAIKVGTVSRYSRGVKNYTMTIYNSTFIGNENSPLYLFSNIDIVNVTFMSVNSSKFVNNTSTDDGGAISVSESVAHVSNSIFLGNQAKLTGGSIYAQQESNINVVNCTFNNSLSYTGGALYVVNSNVKLLSSNFTQNSATNGGVFASNRLLFVTLCNMENNTATGKGGVGYMKDNSSLYVTESDFCANKANIGGVFYVRMSIINVHSSVLLENLAGLHGGAIFADYKSILSLSNATVARNNAQYMSGAFMCGRGTKVSLSETIIHSNSADLCSINCIGCFIDISNSQFLKNIALSNGGCLCIINSSLAIVKNSTFNGNTGNSGALLCANSNIYMENCILKDHRGKSLGVIHSMLHKIYLI